MGENCPSRSASGVVRSIQWRREMKRFDPLLIFSLGVIAIAAPAQAGWPHAEGRRPSPVLTVQANPSGAQAGLEANKAIVRRFIQEVHDEGKFEVFSEL